MKSIKYSWALLKFNSAGYLHEMEFYICMYFMCESVYHSICICCRMKGIVELNRFNEMYIHHSETSKSNESERFNEKSYLHSSTLKTTYFIVIWWQLIILNHKWSHQSLKFSSETFSMLYAIHMYILLLLTQKNFPIYMSKFNAYAIYLKEKENLFSFHFLQTKM